MKSIIDNLPADAGLIREHLEVLLSKLGKLAAPDHFVALTRQFRQTAFTTLLAGQDLLLEYLAKVAENDLSDNLANGEMTGRDAGAVILINALAKAISQPPEESSASDAGEVKRVLGMLCAPGAVSLEMMAGQFVRDCLEHGFSRHVLVALDKLRREGDQAMESAREGLYPVSHPEMMLDIYYFGLFLAAPLLRATMVGYEVVSAKPGLIEEDQKRFSTLANAVEEKLVRIGDAMLYAIRDLGGKEARGKREEIQALIARGEDEKAGGMVMQLVDLQLFYPKPFRSVLLGTGGHERPA
jgi:hypothetical protein